MNRYLESIFNYFRSKPVIQKKSYDAGKVDRLSSHWVPSNVSPEMTNATTRELAFARCRDLERNSDIIEAIITALTRNSIGPGIKLQARTSDSELNEKIERLWKEWCRAKNCDVQGQLNLTDIQKLIIRRRKVDGGIFIRKVIEKDPKAKIKFKLQLLEYDNLDKNLNSQRNEKGISIVNGIEFDDNLKPIAYWFKNEAYNSLNFNSTRVDADKVIHLFKKIRPTQTLGVTEFASVITRIKSITEYLEAEMIAQQVAASFCVFIETPDAESRIRKMIDEGKASIDGNGERTESIGPGMVNYLKPGENVKTAEPGRNAQTAKDFVELQLRLIGAGVGLSYEAISRNMSQVNFSSSRGGTLEDRRTYHQEQQFITETFLREIYIEFIKNAVLSNQLDIKDFWQPDKMDNYLEHEWIYPGWTWVDPKKDAEASVLEINAGISTLADVAASKGKDWQEVLRQRAREQAYAKELGLLLSVDNLDVKYVAGNDVKEDDAEDEDTIE